MNRCETCKHWKRSSEAADIRYYGEHSGECESDKFVYSNTPEEDGLAYWDYEDYSAGFKTGAKFGCVHHEAAE